MCGEDNLDPTADGREHRLGTLSDRPRVHVRFRFFQKHGPFDRRSQLEGLL